MNNTNLIDRGLEALDTCERSLQEILGLAVTSRDYGAILELTSMAQAIVRIASSAKDNRPSAAAAELSTVPESTRPVARKKTADYPQFIRRGEDLVKIGWSKKEKKQYQHKTPRTAVDAVAAALAKVGTDGRVFATDKLLPVVNPDDGTPVPEYQVYVALAWLKHIGLIEQHARQGYSIPHSSRLQADIEIFWQQIPLKQNS